MDGDVELTPVVSVTLIECCDTFMAIPAGGRTCPTCRVLTAEEYRTLVDREHADAVESADQQRALRLREAGI